MNWPAVLASVRALAKPVLEVAALTLSIVNGLMLLRFYWRDRARLSVHPVHPLVYQWWFVLPAGEFRGEVTRRYGFIAYVAVQNGGLRKSQLTSWRLFIRTRLRRYHQLQPINMPEPSASIGEHVKFYPVLGQRGPHFDGETLVDTGCSSSGMVYYLYECYGGEGWNPVETAGQIAGKFEVCDAFGNRATCTIEFQQRPLEDIIAFAPGIEAIDKRQPPPDQAEGDVLPP